jgi:anti-anti-sigma regulatory factor
VGSDASNPVRSRLTASVERSGQVAVMRLEGTLTRSSATSARRNILKWLADGPRVLVLDLSRLTVPDTASVTLFGAMADAAMTRPGQELVVAAPSLSVLAALERLSPRWLRVFDSVVDALDAIDGLVPRRFRELVPPWPGAQWQARRLVDQACATWGMDGLVDPARAIVSALVGNAARHARTDMIVTLTQTSRYLLISVRDGTRDDLALSGPDHPDFPGHRGLVLVHELSREWGVHDVPDGKIVWASLRRPDQTGRPTKINPTGWT